MIEEKSIFRVIKNDKNNAKNNMAIDEALFSCFKENDKPILRVYNWTQSFTVGVSQDFKDYSSNEETKDFKDDYAKRITGGGVLFHGHDLSYSLVIPSHLLGESNIKKSYEKICSFILTFYKNLGLDAKFAKDDENVILSKNEYCQVGFEAYDILVNSKKIGGNAQKRTRKLIFQHGSIPLKSKKSVDNSLIYDKKIGYTLEDFNINIDFEEAKIKLIESFYETFNVDLIYSSLTTEENEKKNKLLKDKYDYK
ncbi:MAG: lipoate--protein ligase family protein [Halarcobacter sp.]